MSTIKASDQVVLVSLFFTLISHLLIGYLRLISTDFVYINAVTSDQRSSKRVLPLQRQLEHCSMFLLIYYIHRNIRLKVWC